MRAPGARYGTGSWHRILFTGHQCAHYRVAARAGMEHQDAYETVFGSMPRIIIASLAAYWCGEFANSFVMARMKVLTGGKHLWMRTIGSTVVGQAVDSILVVSDHLRRNSADVDDTEFNRFRLHR